MRAIDLPSFVLAVAVTVVLMVGALALDLGVGYFYAAFATGFAIIVVRSLDRLDDR